MLPFRNQKSSSATPENYEQVSTSGYLMPVPKLYQPLIFGGHNLHNMLLKVCTVEAMKAENSSRGVKEPRQGSPSASR